MAARGHAKGSKATQFKAGARKRRAKVNGRKGGRKSRRA